MYALKTIALATVTLLLNAPTVVADTEKKLVEETFVTIPDQNLREVILKIKNKYEHKGDQITRTDLKGIYFLDASGKAIRDLTGLEYCNNLSEARFANNLLVDVTPLSSCGSLQSLDLSHNRIVDVGPLGRITKLQYLNVAHNQIESLNGLGKLQLLNSFYAANNRIKSIKPVAQCKRLWSLGLSHNRIKDLSPVAQLPRLSSLWLADNELSDLSTFNFNATNLTTDLRRSNISEVEPVVTMAHSHDADRQQYLPFWKLYLAGNPLSAAARDDLTALAKLGVRIDLLDSQDDRRTIKDKKLVGKADAN